MKKILKFIAPVLVLATGVGVVQAMIAAKPAPEKKEEVQRLVSLHVDQVRADTVTLSVQTQGEVRPKTEIDLVSQVSGRVVAVSGQFAEGAGFEPGSVLLRIDDADYRLALIRAEARVAEAELKVAQELARASIKRKQWESTARDEEPTPLQVNRPQVIEARAQLRSAEAQLAEARLNLERTEITVPFRGRIRERSVGIGEFVSAGSRLGRVFSTDTVEVRLPLTDLQLMELDLPIGFEQTEIQAGPTVDLRAVVGNVEHVWQGQIVRTYAEIDQQTRLIHAVAEISDPYGEGASNGMPLAVGLFVSADIAGVRSQDALVMPREALRNADQVYVVNGENRLEIRTVEVLSSSADRVLVSEGVAAGERVVTSTLPNAVDGMLVQPITALAAN